MLRKAERGDGHEPDQHDRAKDFSDARRARATAGRTRPASSRRVRNRMARWPRMRRGDMEPLDRRKNADRRGDHAVAQQQAGAKHQRQQHQPRRPAGAVVQQAVKREYATLALVLRAQHQSRIFDRHDEGDRPDHQRNAAKDMFRRARNAVAEKLVHGVKRRRADVAVNHPDRRQRQPRRGTVRRVGGARNRDGNSGDVASQAGGKIHRVSILGDEFCVSKPLSRNDLNQSPPQFSAIFAKAA